jgi:hypothetical protein
MTKRVASKMKLRREVGHSGTVPPGWQMAWYEPRRRVGVYYPAPLNRLARAFRELNYRVQLALRAPVIECAQMFEMQRVHHEQHRLADEYANGYMVGWRECYQECLAAVESELTRADDVWDMGGMLGDAAGPTRPKN